MRPSSSATNGTKFSSSQSVAPLLGAQLVSRRRRELREARRRRLQWLVEDLVEARRSPPGRRASPRRIVAAELDRLGLARPRAPPTPPGSRTRAGTTTSMSSGVGRRHGQHEPRAHRARPPAPRRGRGAPPARAPRARRRASGPSRLLVDRAGEVGDGLAAAGRDVARRQGGAPRSRRPRAGAARPRAAARTARRAGPRPRREARKVGESRGFGIGPRRYRRR